MYQLVYNHYFKKGIFSSLCALEAKNSITVPFTELSHLPKFTLMDRTWVSSDLDGLKILFAGFRKQGLVWFGQCKYDLTWNWTFILYLC